MEKIAAVIGFPLKHSLSPAFQQAAFDHLGLAVRYEAWETPPERVGEVVARLRDDKYLGLNVTIPHKETIIPLLDAMDPWAQRLGSVNTVVKRKGQLIGYNTDASGFLRALRTERGFEPQGRQVLVLGAGGVARAVVGALLDAGCAGLILTNHNRERAERLATSFEPWLAEPEKGPARPRTAVQIFDWTESRLGEAVAMADLIVNCTPVGMKHGPEEGHSPLGEMRIPAKALVYDVVYVPNETPLLRRAREDGAGTLGGASMLVYQGVAAFELWTGKAAPVQVMMDALQAALDS